MLRLKKIMLFSTLIIAILIGIGVILAYIYEKDVKSYVIKELNKHLANEIEVKNYNLSFLKKFPYASLEFEEIKAINAPPFPKKDTLFYIQSLYLRFNIFDLLQKKYIIKKIDIENGNIFLKVDNKGNDNWHFWKQNSDTTESEFKIQLDNISLSNVTFSISNELKKQHISLQIIDSKISGNFSEKLFDMQTNATILMHKWKEKELTIIENKTFHINTITNINLETNNYSFQKGSLNIEALSFTFSGNITEKNENLELNINLSGKNHQLSELISLLPKEEQDKMLAYQISGAIDFTGTIVGATTKTENPAFQFSYHLRNGKITEPSSSISIEAIQLKGDFKYSYEKGTRFSSISVPEFTANFSGNKLDARFELRDLWNPYLDIEFHGKLPLTELKNILKIDTLEQFSGSITMNIKLNGFTKSIVNINAEEYKRMKASGNIAISDMALKVENNLKLFSNINGKLVFNNNDVKVDELSGNISGSDFLLSGFFRNLLGFLFTESEVLELSATLYSENILLDELLQSNEKNNEPYHLEISNRIKARLNTAVKNISFRKFKAKHFTSQILLQNKVLQINSITANSMRGIINGDLELDAKNSDNLLISSEATLHQINLREMFYQFENFTQNSLRSEHINGTLNADVQFASVFTSSLEIDTKKTFATSNIQITNGELSNYEPILALSQFISVDELKSIKFSTLKTNIEIKDEKIFLPLTDITSSAINLSVSGSHGFDNRIDYRFRILFNEILWKKAKKEKKENSEFGYEEDDGTGNSILFLKMTGTVDEPQISYDTQGLKKKWKEDVQNEKQTLKQILNKEFGWFKKDSTLKESPSHKKPFTIDWEEENTPEKNVEEKNETTKEKKGIFNKLTQPNKEEYEKFED